MKPVPMPSPSATGGHYPCAPFLVDGEVPFSSLYKPAFRFYVSRSVRVWGLFRARGGWGCNWTLAQYFIVDILYINYQV